MPALPRSANLQLYRDIADKWNSSEASCERKCLCLTLHIPSTAAFVCGW